MKHTTRMTNFTIEAVNETAERGTINISPLPPGFGVTIGNVLRRFLLSSIKGAAITEVRISNAPHMFTTLPGVKEDVAHLILNLKQVRFKLADDKPTVLTLDVKGVKEVKAKDFEKTTGVEVMNPDQYIASLTSAKASLELQVLIEPGYGYVPRESSDNPKIGVLPVDSSYSPIIHVADTVEQTRVGEDTDYEKLVLDIITDKSIKPLEAVQQAAQLAVVYLSKIAGGDNYVDLSASTVADEESAQEESKLSKKEAVIGIEDLDLPLRTINSLKKSGIDSLGDLVNLSEEKLMNIRGLGETSIRQIQSMIENESWK